MDVIYTSDSALNDLWTIVHAKRRKGSTTLSGVPADALEALLKDHHTLITALRERKLLAVTLGTDQAGLAP